MSAMPVSGEPQDTAKRHGMLVVTRAERQSVRLRVSAAELARLAASGQPLDILVALSATIGGRKAKLGFQAPDCVDIRRSECL